ncbi:MAG: GSCFA domain-containing protein [Bacteroidales bacterium]|nr:GSCFA domain-containing protein [Bacteroidales bacterium]
MIKLQTPVETGRLPLHISFSDKIVLLGSCFSATTGERLAALGFEALTNPFGQLYNPVSIANAVTRLSSGIPFGEDDCAEMGAGAGLVCSYSHHTSFARKTAGEFLENANASLSEASAFWKEANKVVITLGTAWCFKRVETGETVANCLKRPAAEFERYRLDPATAESVLARVIERNPGKEFFLAVSPIRHLADGPQGNSVSKATLLLAADGLCRRFPDRVCYFPSFEILLDELRDYRFYAEDLVHPSAQAASYIADRFIDAAVPEEENLRLAEARKTALRAAHRDLR